MELNWSRTKQSKIIRQPLSLGKKISVHQDKNANSILLYASDFGPEQNKLDSGELLADVKFLLGIIISLKKTGFC